MPGELVVGNEPLQSVAVLAPPPLGFVEQDMVDEVSKGRIRLIEHVADRIVFLADGKTVDEMLDPTVESVLDRLKQLEG